MKKKSETLSYHFKGIFKILLNILKSPESESGNREIRAEPVEFRFLTESPNDKIETLKFGHTPIIHTLKQIISGSASSMTIGLFGNWGSGKSSIVENVKKDLLGKRIPVIIFDVWKHDGDALRRTFLQDLDNQLSDEPFGKSFVKKPYILSAQVFGAIQLSREKFSFKTKRFLYNSAGLLWMSCMVLMPLFLLGLLFQFFTGISLIGLLSKGALGTSIGALLTTAFTGGLIYKYIDSFIKVEKTEEKKEKLQDPHEFEREFHSLINNLEADINTLVVVFDNLDRVSGENALKVISTIKTFLDYKSKDSTTKVIFLIPCDVTAIKTHIYNTMNINGYQYVDEFLRKFFNTSLWIPEFYDNELEEFATDKLKETGIADFDNDRLAWLIIKTFNKNPRQVIQFINTLLAHYLVIKEYCQKGQIQDNTFYSTHITELAKFLLLKVRFPEIIDFFQTNNVYKLDDEEILKKLSNEETGHPDVQDFKNLLNRTREIKITSLEPFFKFRLSKDEQQIPDLYLILDKIVNGDDDISFSGDVTIASNIAPLSNVIRNRFNSFKNRSFRMSVVKGSLLFASKYKITFEYSLYKDFLDFVLSSLNVDLEGMDPTLLAEELLDKFQHLQDEDFRRFISHYISIVSSLHIKLLPEKYKSIWRFLVKYQKKVDQNNRTNLDNAIVQRYKEENLIFTLLQEDSSQEAFISTRFKSTIIANITKVTVDEQAFLIRILDKLTYDEAQVNAILAALASSIIRIVSNTKPDQQASVYEMFYRILNKNLQDATEAHQNILQPFITNLNALADRKDYFDIILLLTKQPYLKSKTQLLLVSFINDTKNIAEFEKLIKTIDINSYLEESIMPYLYNRSTNISGAETLLMNSLNLANQFDYIQYLLGNADLDKLKEVWEVLPDFSIEQVREINKLLIDNIKDQITQIEVPALQWTMETVFKLSKQHDLLVPTAYVDIVFELLADVSDDQLFNMGISHLKKVIGQEPADSKVIQNILVDVMYEHNYSTYKDLYEIVFNFFENLEKSKQNRIRDLIYIHLFHSLSDDVDTLNTALYTARFEGKFEFKECESYFNDFIEKANKHQNTEVSTYYIEICKLMLHKLKHYKTASFKDIKDRLKLLIETGSDNK